MSDNEFFSNEFPELTQSTDEYVLGLETLVEAYKQAYEEIFAKYQSLTNDYVNVASHLSMARELGYNL